MNILMHHGEILHVYKSTKNFNLGCGWPREKIYELINFLLIIDGKMKFVESSSIFTIWFSKAYLGPTNTIAVGDHCG